MTPILWMILAPPPWITARLNTQSQSINDYAIFAIDCAFYQLLAERIKAFPVPQLQHEQGPEAVAVISFSALMLVPHAS